MKEVLIKIKEDGSQTIETSGFKGNACLEETNKILKRLSELGLPVEVSEDKKKAEYYETETSTGTEVKA